MSSTNTAAQLATIRRLELTGAAPRTHRSLFGGHGGGHLRKPIDSFQKWLAAGQL